eukprot:m.4730 g.4730  ORF g.4730 m.4730 type:complete len:414 (+) comp11177_c0_seq2:15-1256(+)
MATSTELAFSDVLRLIQDQRKQRDTISKDDFLTLETDHRRCWATLFRQFYIETVENARDDLLFFVKYGDPQSSDDEDRLAVFRKSSSHIPGAEDSSINWEETLYLNIVLQQFDYFLTCGVGVKREGEPLQTLTSFTERVYASPSRRRMDKKGKETSLTYPYVFFTVDNFEEAFKDIIVKEDQHRLIVELVAVNQEDSVKTVIFQGSLSYSVFRDVYLAKASTATKMARKMSFGLWQGSGHVKFVSLRGPGGKGHAQVAICQQVENQAKSVQNGDLQKKESQPSKSRWGSWVKWKWPAATPSEGSSGVNQSSSATVSYRKKEEEEEDGGGDEEDGEESDEASVQLSSSGEAEEPKWRMNRFLKPLGSAVDWWKSRKGSALHLSTCLTYIQLSWERVIEDILNSKQLPILPTEFT